MHGAVWYIIALAVTLLVFALLVVATERRKRNRKPRDYRDLSPDNVATSVFGFGGIIDMLGCAEGCFTLPFLVAILLAAIK